MSKVLIKFPYILKSGPRKEKADWLRQQWNEKGLIVIDSSYDVTVVKDDDNLIIEEAQWIPLTQEVVDMDLKDHCFYLVADKRFGTPMKAIFHSDSLAHFQIVSTSIESENVDDIVYVYDLAGDYSPEGDTCPITHYMELPSLPWEKEDDKNG